MNATNAAYPSVNGRELLSYVFLIAGAALIIAMLSVTYTYVLPRPMIVALTPEYPPYDQPYLIQHGVPF